MQEEMKNVIAKWADEVEGDLKDNNFSGGFIVGHNGEVLHSFCDGYADYEKEIYFSDDTRFGIGSITKQFVAVCILQLVEVGKIALEDTISKYLPEYKYSEQIRIIDLLQMNAGIIDYLYGVLYKNIDWENGSDIREKKKMWLIGGKNYTYSEVLALVNDYPLNEEVNNKMVYSNTNYVFLQEILERVTGKSLMEYLQKHIFQPLKMNCTYLGSVNASSNSYYLVGGERIIIGKGETANGESGMVSTITDLMKWLNAIGSKKILSEELWDVMLQPQRGNYSIAWYKLKNWFYHCGDSMGYRVQVCLSKIYDVQIVFCGNCCEESIDGGFFEKIASYNASLDIRIAKETIRQKLMATNNNEKGKRVVC